MGVASQNSTLPCAIATFPVSLPLSSPGDVMTKVQLITKHSSSITVQLTSVTTCHVFRPSDVCEVDYYTLIKYHCTVNGSHGYTIVYTLYSALIIGVPSNDYLEQRKEIAYYVSIFGCRGFCLTVPVIKCGCKPVCFLAPHQVNRMR